ncbi:MAG UNVERIFIED_CONTAM: hypothetical protein LVR29_04780 [Microcystis novacekii LVE1205-3]|jgi:hypothetical protein
MRGLFPRRFEATALGKEVAVAINYPNNDIIQTLFSQEAVEKAKVNPPAKMEIKSSRFATGYGSRYGDQRKLMML